MWACSLWRELGGLISDRHEATKSTLSAPCKEIPCIGQQSNQEQMGDFQK